MTHLGCVGVDSITIRFTDTPLPSLRSLLVSTGSLAREHICVYASRSLALGAVSDSGVISPLVTMSPMGAEMKAQRAICVTTFIGR